MKSTIVLTIDEVKDAIKEFVAKREVNIKASAVIEPVLNEKDDSFEGFKIVSEIDLNYQNFLKGYADEIRN